MFLLISFPSEIIFFDEFQLYEHVLTRETLWNRNIFIEFIMRFQRIASKKELGICVDELVRNIHDPSIMTPF